MKQDATSESGTAPKFVPPEGGIRLTNPGGGYFVTKAAAADTGGRYSVAVYDSVPADGPPLHQHTHEDEAFYVLEGVMSFWIGDAAGGRVIEAPAGSFVFAPRGVPHAFKNRTGAPAKFLLFVSPPANFEAFYAKIGAARADGAAPSEAESVERIMRHAPEHGITILGPSPL